MRSFEHIFNHIHITFKFRNFTRIIIFLIIIIVFIFFLLSCDFIKIKIIPTYEFKIIRFIKHFLHLLFYDSYSFCKLIWSYILFCNESIKCCLYRTHLSRAIFYFKVHFRYLSLHSWYLFISIFNNFLLFFNITSFLCINLIFLRKNFSLKARFYLWYIRSEFLKVSIYFIEFHCLSS